MVKARPSVALAVGPCVWVGKAHVPKHKLRTGPWVIITGNGPLCMGGCGVRGVFSARVRRLLLSWIPWGWSFPYRPSFLLTGQHHVMPYLLCSLMMHFCPVTWRILKLMILLLSSLYILHQFLILHYPMVFFSTKVGFGWVLILNSSSTCW
jgi:hypothetical protein